MISALVRLAVRSGIAALAVCVFAASASAQATTGTVRGRVAGPDGQPAAGAQVTAVNQETGFTARAQTGADGRFSIGGLLVGPYVVQVRAVGFAPVERRGIRLTIGETVDLSFALTPAATELEAVTVLGEAQPLIDRSRTGYVDLIGENQIQSIPVNGRNFADLVALSPVVSLGVGDGSGGNLSLGGGRRGTTLIQIDGAGSTGTFFGGEARGSDRIPFAYSIESVREFQVVTNAYDVEYGFFVGGLVNAVTKSGTNTLRGSLYGYLRNDALTGEDFSARPATEFKSLQFGATVSGPILRDRLHYFVAIERQDRDEPIFGLPAPGSTPDLSTGVHPDSVQRFLTILQNTYGVTDEPGRFTQTQDETSVFARLDWQPSDRHRLTLRHNYTDLNQQFDRISTNELRGNGGAFLNTGNSTVLSLHSILSPTILNELRVQRATEPRPREAYSLLPEAAVRITSDFGGGSQGRITAECCNDPVLPNNLEESTWEIADNLNIRRGAHALKVGVHFNRFSFQNFFFFRQQGQFFFNSLALFEAGTPASFQRALPNPGPDGLYFTADDVRPLALYDVNEAAIYAQDAWEVNERLTVTAGVRADFTSFPDKAPLNQTLFGITDTSALFDRGYRTDVVPVDKNISPRIGFAYELDDDATRLLRGGAGLFYGRFPSVLYSNSLLNTGENQRFLICNGAAAPAPIPVYQNFDGTPGSIPTQCASGGFTGTPAVNLFDPGFEYPKTWKMSLGYEQALNNRTKIGVDLLYSKTTQNFYVQDANLRDEQFRSGIEDRPVFAPQAGGISAAGRVNFGQNRRTTSFTDLLVHVSPAQARTYQVVLSAQQRLTDNVSWQVAYTYSRTQDNSSYSCCISSTALFETPTAGNPNVLGAPGDELTGTWGAADFDRPHTFVVSGSARLPGDIEISGIWRTASGRPWTPIVDGDANADGRLGNDRAYIGLNLSFDNPAQDTVLLRQFLGRWPCLAEQEGRIASRNSCRNPRNTNVDLRLRRAFPTVRGHQIEIVADFFNVLNVLQDNWGANVGVAGSDTELLTVEGYTAATGTYRYSVNPSFGTLSDLTPFRTDQFQMQVGVRYSF